MKQMILRNTYYSSVNPNASKGVVYPEQHCGPEMEQQDIGQIERPLDFALQLLLPYFGSTTTLRQLNP